MKFECIFEACGNGCDECRYLYDMAVAAPPGAVVEIGAYRGATSVFLCGAADENNEHFYGIDPWDLKNDSDHFSGKGAMSFEQGVKDRPAKVNLTNYTFIKGFSYIVAETFDEPVGFIFIDGCHCTECVKKDFFLWAPKMVPGGVMVFHDAGWAGVATAINLIVASPEFTEFHKMENTKLVTYVKNG